MCRLLSHRFQGSSTVEYAVVAMSSKRWCRLCASKTLSIVRPRLQRQGRSWDSDEYFGAWVKSYYGIVWRFEGVGIKPSLLGLTAVEKAGAKFNPWRPRPPTGHEDHIRDECLHSWYTESRLSSPENNSLNNVALLDTFISRCNNHKAKRCGEEFHVEVSYEKRFLPLLWLPFSPFLTAV